MNLLESLKRYTIVVADTGDFEAIAEHKLRDATTNPSLLFQAAQKPHYQHLVDEALDFAMRSPGDGAARSVVFMDKLFITFGCEILKIVPGRVSTEVDAGLSFDTEGTVAKARKLMGMYKQAHLWAVGYDGMERAEQVRDEIARLGWGTGHVCEPLILLDFAVVVRHPDGSFTFDRKPFPGVANILACTGVGFFAGLVLAAPLTGATIGALLGSAGTAAATHAGISEDFVRDVEALMQPGTSALFVMDDDGDMEVILHAIRGLGGTVLKTNVDLERAKLIQSTLAAASAATIESAG